jgi:hypothetical protein
MRPINTATAPIGAVIKVNQGNTPKELDPSFIASSTNIDAIRAIDRGRMAKIMPPRATYNPRTFRFCICTP